MKMKVDKSKARNPDEEYERIKELLDSMGDFFAWDVHPNVSRNASMQREKLFNKRGALTRSPEFLDLHPEYDSRYFHSQPSVA